MKLFELDIDTNEVKLNRVWLWMVPEFADLLRRDKGSPGDYDGRKKLRAIKEFTYIYFMVDFASPLRDWEPAEKHKEAVYYANLEQKDIDEGVKIALKKYEELFLKSCKSLKTYKSLLEMLDKMDQNYKDIDFTRTDKQGKLLYDPLTIGNSIIKLDQVHTAVANFAKRVEEELTQGPSSIRGTAELGDNEGKRKAEWSERDIAQGSDHASEATNLTKSFTQLGHLINNKS